ncbi:hypothetical protein ABTK28_20895, partial [Acinetobacter baumannii]
KRLRGGAGLSGPTLFAGLERRAERIIAANAALEGIDALILPTSPIPAVPITEVDEAGAPGGLTRFVNYLEWAGVSVPVGRTAAGLPI